MTYRDDEESLRAKVSTLERELADAHAKLARLDGEVVREGIAREVPTSRVTRGPRGVTLVHRLPYEIDTAGYEAIATAVRARLGIAVGQLAQVGRTLSAGDAFSLRVDGGETVIRMHADWSVLAGGVVSITALTALFFGLPTLGVLLDASTTAHPLTPLHALWIVPGLMAGAFVLARGRAHRIGVENLARWQGTMEAVLALSEQHRVRPGVKARVEIANDDDAAEAEARETHRSGGARAEE